MYNEIRMFRERTDSAITIFLPYWMTFSIAMRYVFLQYPSLRTWETSIGDQIQW